MPTPRLPLVLGLAVVLGLANVLVLASSNDIVDDAFIFFRYVDNLLAGNSDHRRVVDRVDRQRERLAGAIHVRWTIAARINGFHDNNGHTVSIGQRRVSQCAIR